MTCSWQDNWVSTSDNIQLYQSDCVKNFPKLEQIKPKEKKVFKSIIWIKDPLIHKKENSCKLGFVLINKNEISKQSDFFIVLEEKIKSKRDIFWSEQFKIDK